MAQRYIILCKGAYKAANFLLILPLSPNYPLGLLSIRDLSFLMYLCLFDFAELGEMVVDVVGNDGGYVLLVLDEFVIEVIELRVLFEERHELIVGAGLCQLVAILLEELAPFID